MRPRYSPAGAAHEFNVRRGTAGTNLASVLPYPSYLRVYEPPHALSQEVQEHLGDGLDINTTGHTLMTEQETALSRAVSSSGLVVEPDRVPHSYVLRRSGHSFFCPTDVSLRSWLSLTSLVQNVGTSTAHLWFTEDSLAHADEAFLRWRQENPSAVPHIRQTTWGIPRTWFVLVAEDERETYKVNGRISVRYRTPISDARRRLGAANAILQKVIDEADLLEELADLSGWLGSFDADSWVELDYAGIASLLGESLTTDQSARDIHRALAALRKGDFATAGEAYREFEERWRRVNAFERAN